jgi:hypothetical protein
MQSFHSNAQKCREALTVLGDCAQFDLAAYQVLANLTSTHAEILKSIRTFSAERNAGRNPQTQSSSVRPRLFPAFV